MTLPVHPNSISLAQIQGEFGGSNPISLSEYRGGLVPSGTVGYPGGGGAVTIPTSGQISFGNFHGSTNRAQIYVTYAANQYSASFNVSSLGGYIAGRSDVYVTVNSGVYLRNNGVNPGLSISGGTSGDNIYITNNGYVLGDGGQGGGVQFVSYSSYAVFNATDGKTALSLSGGGNYSIDTRNGYIAGGGGGGAGFLYGADQCLGGGGGAGGGQGGNAYSSGSGFGWAYGGNTQDIVQPGEVGYAGQIKGPVGWSVVIGGGGGGYVLPGTGGGGSQGGGGGAGGGGASLSGIYKGFDNYYIYYAISGGGGGWGAAGAPAGAKEYVLGDPANPTVYPSNGGSANNAAAAGYDGNGFQYNTSNTTFGTSTRGFGGYSIQTNGSITWIGGYSANSGRIYGIINQPS